MSALLNKILKNVLGQLIKIGFMAYAPLQHFCTPFKASFLCDSYSLLKDRLSRLFWDGVLNKSSRKKSSISKKIRSGLLGPSPDPTQTLKTDQNVQYSNLKVFTFWAPVGNLKVWVLGMIFPSKCKIF